MKTYTINYMNVITKTEHQDIHMALAQFMAEVMAGGTVTSSLILERLL